MTREDIQRDGRTVVRFGGLKATDGLPGENGADGISPSVMRISEYSNLTPALCLAISAVDGTATVFQLIRPSASSPGEGIVPEGWVDQGAGEIPVSILAYILLGALGPADDPDNPNTFLIPGHGGVFTIETETTPFTPVETVVGSLIMSNKYVMTKTFDGNFVQLDPASPDEDFRIFCGHQYTREEFDRSVPVLKQLRATEEDGSSFGNNGWYASNLSLLDLPTGLDVRAGIFIKAPIAIPPEGFGQVLTREDFNMEGGDNFEFATANGEMPPVPKLFGESACVGATREDGTTGDAGLEYGMYAEVRWTVDTANQTMALWRRVPMGGSVTTEDDINWKMVKKITGPKWANIANVDSPWSIGQGLFGSIHWLTAHHFGGDRIIGLTREAIATAGVDAQTVVCEEGIEFTSVNGSVQVFGTF